MRFGRSTIERWHFADRMRDGLAGSAAVIPPQPLRLFGALWSKTALIVTPDSGPMHLAAALDVPTIAILLSDGSWIYRPRTADDLTLMRPTVEEAVGRILNFECSIFESWAAGDSEFNIQNSEFHFFLLATLIG